jgi:SAM-dependent methyltransferase
VHPSAHAHMQLCIERYLDRERHYRVVDLGSRISPKQGATHRQLLAGYDCEIVGVDIQAGRNVDVVMTKPYRVPLRSASVDVIFSGQAFEHIPFFWATFLELARLLRPNGLIFLTAPSRGHMHDVYDCWRYYPDGLRAMAAFARLDVVEAFTDFPPTRDGLRHAYESIDAGKYYWGDSVGVFRKPRRYPYLRVSLVREVVVWWANRIGDLSGTPRPPAIPERARILDAAVSGPAAAPLRTVNGAS